MAKRKTNSIGLRKEWEQQALGLNVSGSYVLRSFDSEEWDLIQQVEFKSMKFSDEDCVVVAQGPQGSLAKFARVTEDRKYARYFGGKFVSVALIEGIVFSKEEFIQSIVQNPTLRVFHRNSSVERIGVLHGDSEKNYKTLVYPVDHGFNLLDIEEDPPPQSLHMIVRILETNPSEGPEIKASLISQFSPH